MSAAAVSARPQAPAPADVARRVLHTATEALAVLTERRNVLADACEEYRLLVSGEMAWEQYDPGLFMLGGDPQDMAVRMAQQKMTDAAAAAGRLFSEYQARTGTEAAE